MGEHYRLNADHSVTPVSLMEWATSFEDKDNRRVARTDLADNTFVSTVFLGLDHQYGEGPPLIFETMVFARGEDVLTWRYSTWAEAEAGHARAVELVEQYRAEDRDLEELYEESPPPPRSPSQ